jgi:hypothetical protein
MQSSSLVVPLSTSLAEYHDLRFSTENYHTQNMDSPSISLKKKELGLTHIVLIICTMSQPRGAPSKGLARPQRVSTLVSMDSVRLHA